MPDIGRIDLRDITLQSGLKSLSNGVETPKLNGANGPSFTDVLKNAVLETDGEQKEADFAVGELVSGENKNIHETMILLEKADVSFKMMMKVRNKILDAYREVMRMNI